MATKKENENKRELARILFMSGEAQKEIAAKTGCSVQTINKWVSEGGWRERRAAQNITRPELVNKLLMSVNDLLDAVNQTKDPTQMAGLSDKLAKFASVIEKLDKKANVVDVIEVFMAFSKWLQYRMATDNELTPELIKAINHYQDKYISELILKGNG
jgi:hypothetical protein